MKTLYNILKYLEGTVLAIGIDQKSINILDSNSKILNCWLLSSKTASNVKTKSKVLGKKINIHKIHKIFKKKKINFLVYNINETKKYLKTLVRNSIYITNNLIYIYGITNEELKNEIIKKYQRYKTSIEIIHDNNNYILKINVQDAKTNIIKDIGYYIIDTIIDIINFISDLLIN